MEIQVWDGALGAEEVGPPEGPAVVLVHGFPFDRRMWEGQLRGLSDAYRMVSYDVRGMGRSPVGDGQYTMELLVDDFFAVVDALELEEERVIACGLSMGGYILLRALERDPGRFRGVVLADTRSSADDDEGKLGRASAIRMLGEEGSAAYGETVVPRLLGSTTLAEKPEVVETAKVMVRSNDPRGLRGAQLAMLSRTDTTASLPGLRLPVLVLVGEEDALTPPETARAMAARIPGADLEIVPRAGHVSALESPAEFNRHLRAFVDRVEASAEGGAS